MAESRQIYYNNKILKFDLIQSVLNNILLIFLSNKKTSRFQTSSLNQTEPKNLHDLPYDVLESIFDHLKLPDLLNVIDSNGAFMQPAIWTFRNHFAHRLFIYNGDSFDFKADIEDEGAIEINKKGSLLKVFTTFGALIFNLQLNNVKEPEFTEINGLIHEKCADRLKYFGIHFEKEAPSLRMTFPNVTSVSFSGGHFWYEGSKMHATNLTLDFNEKFPKMRRMALNQIYTKSCDFLDQYFSNLQHLEIDFKQMGQLNQMEIVRLFRKNPQIKSIKIASFSVKFLRVLEANLRNLECLDLNWEYPSEVEMYRFKYMRKFTFRAYSVYHDFGLDIIPFEFGNELNELNIVWKCEHFGNKWIEFIERNQNIQKLSIRFPESDCTRYPYLTNVSIPNLREIQLHGIDLVYGNRKFFENVHKWPNLMRIKVLAVEKCDIGRFRPEVNPEWAVMKYQNAQAQHHFDILMVKG